MEVQASIKNALTTPRKARLVIDLVRGKTVEEAIGTLNMTPHKASRMVKRLVESATANAVNNYGLAKDNLFVKSITATDGLVMKRWMPRAHGHATKILKRRSHLTICLDEVKKTEAVKEGKKSKMKTFSYDEVKKVMAEAEKASKMIEEKGKKGRRGKEKTKPKPVIPTTGKSAMPGEAGPQKEIDSRPKFSRLGDTFKRLIHRTTKKG